MSKKVLVFATLFGSMALLTAQVLSAQGANPDAFNRGAQGPGRGDGAPTGPAPKNGDGKPDISGAWAPNAIRQNVDLIGSGTEVPMLPWADKVYKEHKGALSKDDEAFLEAHPALMKPFGLKDFEEIFARLPAVDRGPTSDAEPWSSRGA